MMVWLAGGFFLLALTGLPSLIQKKRWRELSVYAAVWLLAAVLAFLLAAGRQPPSPLEGVRWFAKLLFS